MNIFRPRDKRHTSPRRQGKKHSQKLKSPRSSSCHCEAISDNKLQQDSAHQGTGLPMKSLLAQEMSKQKESKKRSPSIIARLMGLDVLPSSQSSSHRQHKSVENQKQQGRSGEGSSYKSLARSSKGGEQKFKDVFEVLDAKKAASNRNLYHQAANLTQAEMAFIRQKFMEAKRLSTDEKLRHSKEFNDALEALDSNKDLLLKFLQQPDSLFTKHLHDLQTTPHKKSPNSQRHVDSHSHRHGGGGCHSHSHTRHASYDTLDLQPTNIVVLKPNHGEPRYVSRAFASPSSSSDEFRADRRLPCTSNHSRQKSNEDIRLSRHSSRDSGEFSKIMYRQRKASRGNGSSVTSFETSGFRGYAGDESSSGSDSPSESELMPVTSRARTAFNRKNYHRSSPSKSSTTSSVTREAKRRLSERWKLTHKYEEEIEIRRSGTLAEMLAASDREARPASFNGLVFEEGISKRVEWTGLPEPVGISSRDGWKGLSSRSFSKSKTIMNQESTYGYTIVLPKELNYRDGLLKGSSSHHGESQSYLSSKSSRPGSYKSHSSYNSSPEVNNISPSLTKFLYQNEKLSPSKSRYSFSVDANSDTEDDSSASDDMKTAMSSEAPDLSTVTSLTDPDISRMPTEDVNHSLVPEPQSRESSKEGDQPSPVSVLEASFDDDVSSTSECFESVSADLQGLRKQLQLLKLESGVYNEGGMLVSSDEDDTDQEESSTITDETLISQEVREEEDWKSLYLVDLLANSRFSNSDHTSVVEIPVDPSLFEDLEKKYSSVKTSTRLDRKFLFDQISRELMQILKQFSDPHPWVKPTRVCQKWDTNMIQETLRDLVTRKDGKPSKDDVEEKELQWLRLEDDIEIIGREIEEMLTDELLAELVLDAIF
ncbi:hypothetical protein BRARA_D00524 [Brassica rapa]|uniref:DUF4378 domain-containing protein n=1 Tax=Brassica campestris TaxID=3711 RepID=A0A397ZRQ6_BRACM|nr:hypothetical protein BRARA_D00524 [Brassica rapa]